MNASQNSTSDVISRAHQLTARLRRRQLDLARAGRVVDSARYAQWNQRVRRYSQGRSVGVAVAGNF